MPRVFRWKTLALVACLVGLFSTGCAERNCCGPQLGHLYRLPTTGEGKVWPRRIPLA